MARHPNRLTSELPTRRRLPLDVKLLILDIACFAILGGILVGIVVWMFIS